MSIWHYKAELIRADADTLEYRYFPDHVMAPGISGVFRVRPADWSWTNSTPARAEERGLVSIDERCIDALVHKLKKAYAADGVAPPTVFFIA
jgi:hypothetical protein